MQRKTTKEGKIVKKRCLGPDWHTGELYCIFTGSLPNFSKFIDEEEKCSYSFDKPIFTPSL